ncbi:MAG: CD3072 family TudS-related putative desulfidase [Leptolinea sp.]
MENPAVHDSRSKKLVFLSHCCLNQNARMRGLADYPGVVKPLLEYLIAQDVGIYQMACPEVAYFGTQRWGQVKEQFDTPMFRTHCQKLVDQILDQVEDYIHGGYTILAFIMMDGSPVCGMNRIPVAKNEGEQLGGMIWYMPQQKHADGQGVFTETLIESITRRGLKEIPFVGYPTGEENGLPVDDFAKIKALFE